MASPAALAQGFQFLARIVTLSISGYISFKTANQILIRKEYATDPDLRIARNYLLLASFLSFGTIILLFIGIFVTALFYQRYKPQLKQYVAKIARRDNSEAVRKSDIAVASFIGLTFLSAFVNVANGVILILAARKLSKYQDSTFYLTIFSASSLLISFFVLIYGTIASYVGRLRQSGCVCTP